MRKFPGPLLRTAAGALTLADFAALALATLSVPAATRAGTLPSPEAARPPFAPRHRTVRHGGFARAANGDRRAVGGGRVGRVAYDGGRGRAGGTLTFAAGPRRTPVALAGSPRPADDVPNSTINGPGAVPSRWVPAYANTLGYDFDVSDLGAALRHGGDRRGFRLVSHADAAWAGALFVAADAR
ncbi:hypothetical protein ABZ299_10995 [Streptomyces sp. NPDC006184]|uniref:hypothetical protein n=1 Tax=Streptomyces sp. NPDC006184 TaxID=3155455 RepID=UPI0033AEB3BF